MVIIKSQLNKKEKFNIKILLEEIPDIFSDFYITRRNLRLFIKENLSLFFDCLNKGDKIVFDDKDNIGVSFITGWSDNAERKYIKILAKDEQSTYRLLKVSFWNIKEALWWKGKKNNPIKEILQRNGFTLFGYRGLEVLLLKKEIKNRS